VAQASLRRAAAVAAIAVAATAAALAAGIPGARAAPAARTLLIHASLVSSEPADGTVVPRAPSRVTATFDQPVAITATSLEVYAPDGSRVDTANTTHAGADTIAVGLKSALGNGTYTATWHVVSADTHPVQGAFTFSVGSPSPTHVGALLPAASPLVGALYAMDRWLEYSFFAILCGGVAFLIVCWPAGGSRRDVRRLVVTGSGGLFCSTLLALLLQGPYGLNDGLGQMLSPALLSFTLHSRLGVAVQVRELLCVLAGLLANVLLPLLPASRSRARFAVGAAWAVLTTVMAVTWASSDHASTGIQVPLALPADVVHLDAMAVWIGGLVVLAGFALRGPATAAVVAAVPRFSAIALGCVATIVASGVYQTWRQVGTWNALADTAYGRLVVAKIAGMCLLIGLGYLARRVIERGLLATGDTAIPLLASATTAVGQARAPEARTAVTRRQDGGPRAAGVPHTRRLRRSVTAEVVVAAAILGFTAVLVNTATGREAYAPTVRASEHFSTGGPRGSGTVHVFVAPARLGPNTVEVYFSTSRGPAFVPAQVQVSLYFPARSLGPLPVALSRTAPGQYRTQRVIFTFTGQWQLAITIRSDAFDETTVYVPVAVH
jgi:copper transport protein